MFNLQFHASGVDLVLASQLFDLSTLKFVLLFQLCDVLRLFGEFLVIEADIFLELLLFPLHFGSTSDKVLHFDVFLIELVFKCLKLVDAILKVSDILIFLRNSVLKLVKAVHQLLLSDLFPLNNFISMGYLGFKTLDLSFEL